MKLFTVYCNDCRCAFNEEDVIEGKTKAVDEYINPSCPECGSESIHFYKEEELCHICDNPLDDDFHYDEQCAEELLKYGREKFYGRGGYGLSGELWAIKFINSFGQIKSGQLIFESAIEYMECYEISVKDFIINENCREFVEWVNETINDKIQEERKLSRRVEEYAMRAAIIR